MFAINPICTITLCQNYKHIQKPQLLARSRRTAHETRVKALTAAGVVSLKTFSIIYRIFLGMMERSESNLAAGVRQRVRWHHA